MKLTCHKIKKEELSHLMLNVAKNEGWHYSEADVDFYFNCPGNKITAIKCNDELSGCVIFHTSAGQVDKKPICSVGFFIVIEKYRGKKLIGPSLWEHAVTANADGTLICFHSVPRAVNFYERLHYTQTLLTNFFYALDLGLINQDALTSTLLPLGDHIARPDGRNFQALFNYNAELFSGESGLGICSFNQSWLSRSDALVIAYYQQGRVKGYGVLTVCNQPNESLIYRLSPLYSDSPDIALALLTQLIHASIQNKATAIELSSFTDLKPGFKAKLNQIGFFMQGTNCVVSNQAESVRLNQSSLDHVYAGIPLEYPPEVSAIALHQ